MKFKNNELGPLLINLLAHRQNGEEVESSGLLSESISLGVKRRLEKIRLSGLKFMEEYHKAKQEVISEMEKKALALLPKGAILDEYKTAKEGSKKFTLWKEAKESLRSELKKEMDELDAEEVEIPHEPVSLAMIEKIESKHVYNWEMIERIAV